MSRKRFSIEQIINHLREAEVLVAQGQTVGEICRRIGVSEQSYYRWRRESAFDADAGCRARVHCYGSVVEMEYAANTRVSRTKSPGTWYGR